MSEDTKAPTEGAPENATATAAEPPSDFREYVKWHDAGALLEKPSETPPPAAAAPPPAKTVPQSGAEATPTTDDEDDVEGDKTGRGSSRIRRIDRLTRENELLKAQLAGMQPKPAAAPAEPPKPAEPPGKPKLHDYATLEAYQEALTDWKLDQRDQQKKAEAAQAEAKSAEEKIQAAWSKSEDTTRAAHADYDEVIQSVKAPEGPGVMAARQAMLEDENGAEILYHLATHPEELSRIAALQPISAVREIGRLSATIAPTSSAAASPKPKVSGAPRPPAPLSRPSAGTTKKDILDENFARDDFRGWSRVREAQLKGQ